LLGPLSFGAPNRGRRVSSPASARRR
jgi:hypothetical protein